MPRDKTGHFYYSWYPTIYQADTQSLTLAEDGAYRRLIDHYMLTRSPLPADDRALARIIGIGIDEWLAMKNLVGYFFKPSRNPDGYLTHSFCDEILAKDVSRINKCRTVGKLGGRPVKHGKTKEITQTVIDSKPITELNRTELSIKDNTNVLSKKPKVTLDELSVDHIADWLAQKRSEGRYIDHDPIMVLEKFKDYCKSRGKKYADYKAAYRGAFDWDKCQPTKSAKPTWRSEGERLAAKYTAEAEQAEAEFNARKNLRAPEAVR